MRSISSAILLKNLPIVVEDRLPRTFDESINDYRQYVNKYCDWKDRISFETVDARLRYSKVRNREFAAISERVRACLDELFMDQNIILSSVGQDNVLSTCGFQILTEHYDPNMAVDFKDRIYDAVNEGLTGLKLVHSA